MKFLIFIDFKNKKFAINFITSTMIFVCIIVSVLKVFQLSPNVLNMMNLFMLKKIEQLKNSKKTSFINYQNRSGIQVSLSSKIWNNFYIVWCSTRCPVCCSACCSIRCSVRWRFFKQSGGREWFSEIFKMTYSIKTIK